MFNNDFTPEDVVECIKRVYKSGSSMTHNWYSSNDKTIFQCRINSHIYPIYYQDLQIQRLDDQYYYSDSIPFDIIMNDIERNVYITIQDKTEAFKYDSFTAKEFMLLTHLTRKYVLKK